ncbi:MAG TPA: VOC family protein [Candidatus Acidoferrum sp.]|nr:VOC family protein [Candidatus Acidoferrum sp.]
MVELKQIVAFVITTNPEATKRFYQDGLGFKFLHDDGFALVFDANGTMLRAGKFKPGQFEPTKYTILGWEVADIGSTVAELKRRGVFFERYDPMPQDKSGIWTAPNGDKVAWFKDPAGNVLSVSQHVPRPSQ